MVSTREKVGKYLWQEIISTRYLGGTWASLWSTNQETIMQKADEIIAIIEEAKE